jgi:hypothetical protein
LFYYPTVGAIKRRKSRENLAKTRFSAVALLFSDSLLGGCPRIENLMV